MAPHPTRMTARELRRELKRRIDRLSEERLAVADDFLAYVEERESDDATAELLRIPGLLDELKEAERDIAEGKTASWREVRHDV